MISEPHRLNLFENLMKLIFSERFNNEYSTHRNEQTFKRKIRFYSSIFIELSDEQDSVYAFCCSQKPLSIEMA